MISNQTNYAIKFLIYINALRKQEESKETDVLLQDH